MCPEDQLGGAQRWPGMIGSVAAMRRLAATVAGGLTGGDVLLLDGELGSGKTTFVQALAQSLGVVGVVTSPTFTIAVHYPIDNHGVLKVLVHVDLYRLPLNEAVGDPAVVDVLAQISDGDRVTVIEWAERLGDVVLPQARRLTFEHGAAATERWVTVTT